MLRNILSLKARIILFYGVLLLPIGTAISEMYGRVSNIGYGTFYIVFVIMLWFFFAEHSSLKKIINYSVLLLCNMTNPVCYIILASILVYDFFQSISIKSKSMIIPIFVGIISLLSTGIMLINKVGDIVEAGSEINSAELVEYFLDHEYIPICLVILW